MESREERRGEERWMRIGVDCVDVGVEKKRTISISLSFQVK